MIYGVYLDGVSIYGFGENTTLLEASCEQELNGAGSCKIKMPYNHASYDDAHVLTSTIDIKEGTDIIWTGRVTTISTNWKNDKNWKCSF